jgi:hypothetical protein
MINIDDLLIRFRQGSRPAPNAQVAVVTDRDRSSMAEFVRILQAYDQPVRQELEGDRASSSEENA